MSSTIRLPWGLQRRLEAASVALLRPTGGPGVDFSRPLGEPALVSPHSVSWRVFKNPVALFVGGVAAVILELAEPSVRSAVWEHSTFRSDPLSRLRRTGLAAMVTVYGARSIAEPMISRITHMHSQVTGITPAGARYVATDPRLLTWVHATAAFGFAHAYSRYVQPLRGADFDALYGEAAPAANLYGVPDPPTSSQAVQTLFEAQRGRLEPSAILLQFLDLMRETPALPPPLFWLQPLLIRAAVDLLPAWIRDSAGLRHYELGRREAWLVRTAGAVADRIVLRESPAAQSCLRMGLPTTHLYS